MAIAVDLLIIVFSSVIIYFAGNRFSDSSSRIGDYLHIPRSVKGATLDAIAGSFPEIMVALFAVISFGRFEVGIGTIAGSALFNLLIIPSLCVFFAPVAFKVGKDVITRDSIFYNISVLVLLCALLYSNIWGLVIPIIFLLIYGWYLRTIVRHTNRYKGEVKQKKITRKISVSKEVVTIVISMIIIAIGAYYLTGSSIGLAEFMGIHPIIISFTVIAIATSLPDAVISVSNAKKGDTDDAASNVFGSNIFDIFVGIGIPLILAIYLSGPVAIVFNYLEIIVGLLGATVLVTYFMANDNEIGKNEAKIMFLLYFVFMAYIILLSSTGT
jgi:cation:H+ antiporter